ncbi:MAG: class I SAM-dependent methyltransferase [Thalassovita sp.]
MVLTSTKDQTDLPRYFSQVFDIASRMTSGQLDFVLPDGRVFRAAGQTPGGTAVLQIKNPESFARLIREGDLGFCDAYIDGWWDTPDLQAFLDLLQGGNDELYEGFPGMFLVRAYERMRHWMNRNTKKQARKNISAHYDLGNDFYAKWLDPSMTYSSALFEDPTQNLQAAQASKYASMLDQMGAQKGDHILEIGCGWGGFAEFAARHRGVRVTGLTISQEQLQYAQQRIEKAGLSDLVDLKMQDYRDEDGQYDGIASIEMFEAVGEQYWPVYFDTLKRCLKPGKCATLQIITLQEKRWKSYSKGVDFIQKYIFPGGMLPSPSVLRSEIDKAGLSEVRSIEFAESYSQTLRLWHQQFNDRWPEIEAMGFDARFRRMWNFYLTSCAASFHGGNCDVTQITVTRPADL